MLDIEDKDWSLVKHALLAWSKLSGVEFRLHVSNSDGPTRNWLTADLFLQASVADDDETLKAVAPAIASVVRTEITNHVYPHAEHAHDLTWFSKGETNELLRPLPFPVRVEVSKREGGTYNLKMLQATTLIPLMVPRNLSSPLEVHRAIFHYMELVRREGSSFFQAQNIQCFPRDLGERSFLLFISR